jgi:hypothetical protein
VPQELRRLAIAHPVSALLPWEGQKLQHMRYDIVKFCPLTFDAGQRELRLSLGELHGWLLGPERWKPYDHSGYLRRLGAVYCLHSPSGSPMWNHARHMECSWWFFNGPPLVSGTGRMKTVAVLDVMKSGAVPDRMKSGADLTGRRSGRIVLVTVKWHEHSRSWLAGARSFLMQVGFHSFVVQVAPLDPLTLGAMEAPFLISCRLAER